jgi:hypothetical protein
MEPNEVRREIERLKRASVEARLALIEHTLPEAMRDARTFVEGTLACPWEFAVAFVDGEYAAIQARYGVRSSRHRPHGPDLPPVTAIFYEACELLLQKMIGEPA